jgi:ribosomal protein S18 acetylase RimI-like enzyme
VRHTQAYELRPPRTEAEWDVYHSLREHLLFDRYHAPGSGNYFAYDRNHPDERARDNHPLVLLENGRVIGTVRIDLKPDGRAVLRQITIAQDRQGRHVGQRLLAMAEVFAADCGAHRLCLNAVGEALGFYRRQGFQPFRWPGCTTCRTSVPMVKDIPAFAAMALAA